MGMIQQSINQTLSLAGFLYSQTEDAKKAQKISGLESKLSQYDEREKLLREAYNKTGKTNKDMGDMLTNKIKLQEERAKILEELYENDPTMERHDIKQKLKSAIGKNRETLSILEREDIEDQQREEARVAYEAEMAQEEQANQTPASNVETENWETPAEKARKKADEAVRIAQAEKREMLARKKGFTSQRYGTNKTKITFGGNQ